MTHNFYETLKVFPDDSDEYRKLKAFAEMLNAKTDHISYSVKTVYFDAGQNWEYTTILASKNGQDDPLGAWQALTPMQQMRVVNGVRLPQLRDELIAKYADR